MATFVSIIRELGFRGCLFFAVVMAFGYWTVTGWMTGGWMTGLGYMVAGGAVGATVVSGRIDGPVHMALGCVSFFLTLAAFS